MKVLVASDKFKGSLTAKEVGIALKNGILCNNSKFNVTILPMADGGDGSLNIIQEYLKPRRISIDTVDALGRPIRGTYLIKDNIAFIELAIASGLSLLSKEEQNPMNTSTKGTGILIKDAISKGVQKIYLFLGGSATNDAGLGIASQLGLQLYDEVGEVVLPVGKNLHKIKRIDRTALVWPENMELVLICDVQNPLHGPNGAAHIYAHQKGANKEEIELLDSGLRHIASMFQNDHPNISTIEGLGAAGGVGASLLSLFGARLQPGFDFFSEIIKLEEHISQHDFIITGEGKIDFQSLDGKVVNGVSHLAKKLGKPIIGVCGIFEKQIDKLLGLDFLYDVRSRSTSEKDSFENAHQKLFEIGVEIAHVLAK